MTPEIFQRLIATVIIIGGGWAAFSLVNHSILRRNQSPDRSRGLESMQPGRPAILYFTTPDCVPCKTAQRPALAKVKQSLGERLQIIEVDCTVEPELANYWGVLSVPTTFIIDPSGRPRQVNHGVTSAEKLLGQLNNLEGTG